MKDEYPYVELDDLLMVEEGLTDWEVEFIKNAHSQRLRNEELTGIQHDKLFEIWKQTCLRSGIRYAK